MGLLDPPGLTRSAADDRYAPPTAAVQDLIGRIRTGVRDVNLLIISDSTATPATGWARALGQALAPLFPTHTFQTRFWDGTSAYSAAESVVAGSGARSVTVWVAAKNSQTWQHFWLSSIREARLAVNPDLVLISLGHNEPQSAAQVGNVAAYRQKVICHLEEFRSMWPDASVVLMSQNPLIANNAASAHRADLYRRIAAQRGYGFIDIEAAFKADGRALATLIDTDGVHPVQAGQDIWLAETVRHFRNARAAQVIPAARPAFQTSGRNLIPDPTFAAFDGTTLANWSLSNATVSRDTTNFETGTWGLKLVKTAASSNCSMTFTLPLSIVKGQFVTLAIRVRIPAGQLGSVGQPLVQSNAGNQVSDIWDMTDQFFWRATTYRVPANATLAQARVFLDMNATATINECTIDRIVCSLGDYPADVAA